MNEVMNAEVVMNELMNALQPLRQNFFVTKAWHIETECFVLCGVRRRQ